VPDALRLAARIVIGLAGAAGIAMGVSALTKLGGNVDSPVWTFAVFGGIAIAAGLGLLWSALFGLGRHGRSNRESL
jgi:uncharacterized membrane protein